MNLLASLSSSPVKGVVLSDGEALVVGGRDGGCKSVEGVEVTVGQTGLVGTAGKSTCSHGALDGVSSAGRCAGGAGKVEDLAIGEGNTNLEGLARGGDG